jgi:hypothetical protein
LDGGGLLFGDKGGLFFGGALDFLTLGVAGLGELGAEFGFVVIFGFGGFSGGGLVFFGVFLGVSGFFVVEELLATFLDNLGGNI